MAIDSKPPAGYTAKSVGVNSWLAAHASLSRAPHFPGRGAGEGGEGVAGVDVIIYTSSCATIHHSDSERSRCQFPCWLFLCLQKAKTDKRSGIIKAAAVKCRRKKKKILHAFCRHLHNANTKCMLFSLCHYGLHPRVKGQLVAGKWFKNVGGRWHF